MKKQYIMPQTEAQHITAGQLICFSPNPSIQKGDPLNGEQSGGMFV